LNHGASTDPGGYDVIGGGGVGGGGGWVSTYALPCISSLTSMPARGRLSLAARRGAIPGNCRLIGRRHRKPCARSSGRDASVIRLGDAADLTPSCDVTRARRWRAGS